MVAPAPVFAARAAARAFSIVANGAFLLCSNSHVGCAHSVLVSRLYISTFSYIKLKNKNVICYVHVQTLHTPRALQSALRNLRGTCSRVGSSTRDKERRRLRWDWKLWSKRLVRSGVKKGRCGCESIGKTMTTMLMMMMMEAALLQYGPSHPLQVCANTIRIITPLKCTDMSVSIIIVFFSKKGWGWLG